MQGWGRREEKKEVFRKRQQREVWKIKKSFFWLLVVVFFHYNSVSIDGNGDIKWNSILLLLHVEYKIYNSIRIGFHMLPWRLLMNSLNNTSFGTKHNIQNLQNTQLKFVLQNGLQQQRKNPHIKILNWDCTCDTLSKATPIILQTNRKSYNTKFRIQTISSSQQRNC